NTTRARPRKQASRSAGVVRPCARSLARPSPVAQRCATRSFATLACLHADPTVLVMCRVTMAFCPACGASASTDREMSADQIRIRLEQARQHASRDVTGGCAVGIEANAAAQRGDIVFGEASIRAGDTCLLTLQTSRHTLD